MRLWQKLAIALVLGALLPLAVATFIIVDGDAERLTEGARARHLAIADVALGEIRSLLARALAEMRGLGHTLAQEDQAPTERDRAFRAGILAAELVDQVAVYGPDGQRLLVARARSAAKPWAPPERLTPEDMAAAAPTSARGYAAWAAVQRDDAGFVLPLVIAATTPAPDGLAVPSTPAGPARPARVYAYLVADIDLQPLVALVRGLSERHFARPDRVRVLSEDLRVLAAGDPKRQGASIAGSPALAEPSAGSTPFRHEAAYAVDYVEPQTGEALVGAVVPLPELGWAALVEESQSEAYAAITATWRAALVVGGAATAIAIVLALITGRRLAKPVAAVARAAARVAAGDFSVRIPARAAAGKSEVAEMGQAFNRMAVDLGSYRDRLVSETRARENLSRFMSPEVVEMIVRGDRDLALGGEKKEITILFADVVSFTRLTERLEPERVVAILNELFTIITEIVFQHGGIIDKFIGDAAMALWGAPEAQPDGPLRAAQAADAIARWLEVGNARWRKELGHDVELAMALHTGVAVVGNIGSEKRMEYTAIGNAVNICARLEQIAQAQQILLTRDTLERLDGAFETVSLGHVALRGRTEPTEIFLLKERA